MTRFPLAACLIAASLLTACKEDVAATVPDPSPLTPEVLAHYCMMNISEHPGPKAQIYLDGMPDPIFFAQVRDAMTYLHNAEQDGYLAAFYVNDMSSVPWEEPGPENWIMAETAHYVVGSTKRGGMGAPEIAPFSDPAAAARFADEFGGETFSYPTVPAQAFLAPVTLGLATDEH